MGSAVNEDERPTSNIQRPISNEKINIQYPTLLNSDSSRKLLFPRNPKSAIQNRNTHRIIGRSIHPTDLLSIEIRHSLFDIRYSKKVGWVERSKKMGFALPIIF
jgi:hypothetical protein